VRLSRTPAEQHRHREPTLATSDTPTSDTPAKGPRPRRPTAKGTRTRQEIIEAAVSLFAESGFRGTGLMAIGERAGVTHAAVLYHFGSAEGLLMAVLDERLRRFDEATGPAFSGDPVEILRALPEIARFNVANPELTKLYMVLKAENIDEGQPAHDYFVAHRRGTRRRIQRTLEEGIEQGQIRPDLDVAAKADEIVAFLGGAESDAFLDPDRLDLVTLYENFTAALLADLLV
jgi:AcrR family transcriptional regulator